MMQINTIDLWTEQQENHLDCFCGSFSDGLENFCLPFDTYKVIKNCNCIISVSRTDINIRNKHNAIVFYKEQKPVRLVVINKDTDVDKCIELALSQSVNGVTLKKIYELQKIKRIDINLGEPSIHNNTDKREECDIGSCDRPSLLECMLQGSYTESTTEYGKNNLDLNFTFHPNIFINYTLKTDTEYFEILHCCAFVNETMTRIIPLQEHGTLDIEKIRQKYQTSDWPRKLTLK